MKKLFIEFRNGCKVTYTMKDFIDYEPYLNDHKGCGMTKAVLQQYPKKDNEPIVLFEEESLYSRIRAKRLAEKQKIQSV